MFRASGLAGSILTCWAISPAQLVWFDCENLPQRIRLVLIHTHTPVRTHVHEHTCTSRYTCRHTIHTNTWKKKRKCFQNRQEYKKAGECHSRDMITQNNYYSTLEMTAEQGKNGLCVIACLVYISMHVHVRVGACEYECQRSSLSQEPCTLLFKQCLSLMWTSSLLLWLVSYKIHLSSKSQHQNHKLVWHLSF